MKVVIIGAGQTGRGYIAPFFYRSNAEIIFADKNIDLIKKLNSKKEYEVKYFGVDKIDVIDSYNAYHIADEKLVEVIADADIITTSVFANQIASFVPLLKKAISKRTKTTKLIILCIENGVNVKQPLIDENIDASISEGIIFCTSIKSTEDLTITSEAGIDLPIDNTSLNTQIAVEGIKQIDNFIELIQRKIYTYNYISAIVAYMGSYKGYTSYAEAANDIEISRKIEEVLPILNRLISELFDIDIKEQTNFSLQAINKFKNHEIVDSIERNAQQVERKLSVKERLLTPIRLSKTYDLDYSVFIDIIVYALIYGKDNEGLDAEYLAMEVEKSLEIYGINGVLLKRFKELYKY